MYLPVKKLGPKREVHISTISMKKKAMGNNVEKLKKSPMPRAKPSQLWIT